MRIHTPRITGSLEVSSSVLSIDNAGTVSGSATSTGSFGHFNTAELGSDVSTLISGSITESSASFSTRVTTEEGNVDALQTDSGSFSTRVTTTEASGSIFDGDGSPTFADLTVTGRITAEQFQTKFVSASIALITGSNAFGDESTDIHSFTGSVDVSGSVTIDAGNIVFNEDSADYDFRVESNGNENMLFVDGGQNRVGIGTNNPATTFHVSESNGGVRFTFGSDSELDFARDANGVFMSVGSNQHLRFLYDNQSSEAIRIADGGNVGIGTNNPSTLTHIYKNANSSESLRIQNDDTMTSLGVSSDGYSFLTLQHNLAIASYDGSTWTHQGWITDDARITMGNSATDSGRASTGSVFRANSNGNAAVTLLAASNHSAGVGTDIVSLNFAANNYWGASKDSVYAQIRCENGDGTYADRGQLVFATGYDGATINDRMIVASNGNVGIATATPSEKLHIYDGDILVSSGRGVRANGGQEMIRFNSSNGVLINSGNSLRMQFYRSGEVDLQGVYGENVGSGAGTAVVRVSSGGRLGVDTSSKRFKTNISDIENFNWIQDLRVVDFVWKKDNSKDWGLIAEEVEKIKPELVTLDDDGKPFSVHYDKLTVLLLKQIQELSAKVEALEG